MSPMICHNSNKFFDVRKISKICVYFIGTYVGQIGNSLQKSVSNALQSENVVALDKMWPTYDPLK